MQTLHKVDAKLIKESKVDAKPIKEEPKVYSKPVKEPKAVAPKVYFNVQIMTERKFNTRDEIMACVHDVAYKLRFVVVSAKYDYGMCS
jgi:hypothetical protein